MQHITSIGWGLTIILMICFVISLLMLMRKPKEQKEKISND